MKIAIIDTGIDKSHPRLQNISVTGISIDKNDNGDWEISDDFNDEIGHGTGCASIICKHMPDCELVAIKIFRKNRHTHEDALIKALEWVEQQADIKIVNVSLGTSTSPPAMGLVNICDKLSKAGVIIVAACNNNIEKIDYPASFASVFGVTGGQIRSKYRYGFTDNGFFIAKGSIQRVAHIQGKDIITTGTSYATAHFVGIIDSILSSNPKLSYDKLKEKLIAESDKTILPIQFRSRTSYLQKPILIEDVNSENAKRLFMPVFKFDWIKRIALFPVSEKEMRHFLDFSSMSQFEVSLHIDYPRSFSSFRSTQTSRDNNNVCRVIPSAQEFDSFDTMVVGYYLDSLWEANIIFGNQLIDQALINRKNFFLLDKRVAEYINKRIIELELSYQPKIYYPKVDTVDYDYMQNYDILPNVRVPCIMAIGTNSRIGKFTVQLRLKQIFESEGYKVGFISSEPHGELFGANYVIPIGHRRTVELYVHQFVAFVRIITRAICYYTQPHVIVLGTQGSFIPENPLSAVPQMGIIESVGYAYGALPDLIVCAIDPLDKIEYIQKTIQIAQSYTKAQVAFYAITPYHIGEGKFRERMSPKKLKERILAYEQELGRPVMNIMDEESSNRIRDIIVQLCS